MRTKHLSLTSFRTVHENNWKKQDFKIDFQPFGIKGVPPKNWTKTKTTKLCHISACKYLIFIHPKIHISFAAEQTVHFPEVFSGTKRGTDSQKTF